MDDATDTGDKKAAKAAKKAEKGAVRAAKKADREARREVLLERLERQKAEIAEAKAGRRSVQLERTLKGSFGGWSLESGEVRKGRGERHDVAGAEAAFDIGAPSKRMTATRVVGGAILASAPGMVVGAMARKNKSRCYVTIALADGQVVVIEEHAKEEAAGRRFAALVNTAGTHFLQKAAASG